MGDYQARFCERLGMKCPCLLGKNSPFILQMVQYRSINVSHQIYPMPRKKVKKVMLNKAVVLLKYYPLSIVYLTNIGKVYICFSTTIAGKIGNVLVNNIFKMKYCQYNQRKYFNNFS